MGQGKDWNSYWTTFIKKKRLENYVKYLDEADNENGRESRIKDICKDIYEDYTRVCKQKLGSIQADFLKELSEIQGIYLQTSRIKARDSLLEKVITKRYSYYRKAEMGYLDISGGNYKNVITDLIGVRIILKDRGDWRDVHQKILKKFPLNQSAPNNVGITLAHSSNGEGRLVQLPFVYYAQGDSTQEFLDCGLAIRLHEKGYRSIHYTISYQQVYVEIQVRTIYDEAWNNYDHDYVYKQDRHKSYSALKQISHILCKLTNISSDMGENMKEIFEKQSYADFEGKWLTDKDSVQEIESELLRLEAVVEEFRNLRNQIQVRQEVGDHETSDK
ncbi:MAG: hypothetical protein NC417_05120 [Candidatus Gastranaerophilales bacterium]|nr:hypothetical protein [Candidatus Gastranaerophilales bacterium]